MEVAKHYRFKEEDDLKQFTDFVIHEPASWFSGFPKKYQTEKKRAIPKAAFVKLMKTKAIQDVLTKEYCLDARDKIWRAFKELQKSTSSETCEQEDSDSVPELPTLELVDDIVETQSIHSIKQKKPLRKSEDLLVKGLRDMIHMQLELKNPLAPLTLSLLDAYLASR